MEAGKSVYLLVSILTVHSLFARERCLQLERKGTSRDIAYFAGDDIVFRMKYENFSRHDRIRGFTDTTIVFESYEVPVRELKFIRYEVTDGFMSPSNGPKLIIAGLVLIAADYLNYTLIRGNPYEPDKELFIIAGAMMASGGWLMSMRYHKFRSSGNRKIVIKVY